MSETRLSTALRNQTSVVQTASVANPSTDLAFGTDAFTRTIREQYEYPTAFSQYFAFLRAPRKCLNFHIKLLCHGRGREFESRRPRHNFSNLQNRLHPRAGTKRDQRCTGSWALRRSFGPLFRDEEPNDSRLRRSLFGSPGHTRTCLPERNR